MVLQNYTTYNEVDPNNRFTIGINNIDVTGIQRGDNCYVYKDFGANKFGDFTHYVSVTTPSAYVENAWGMIWGMSNGSFTYEKQSNNTDGFNVALWGSGSQIRLVLNNMVAGTNTYYVASANTTYYLDIRRSGTSLTCAIYSDAARTVLLTTLTLVVTTVTYRYAIAAGSRQRAGGDAWSYTIFDLDFPASAFTDQTTCELAGCYWWAGTCHEGPVFPYDSLASGYLAQFQNTVIKGIYSVSGDYRTVHVNESGHVLVDVEVVFSSGMSVVVESGVGVLISGQHVYVESGIWVAGLSFSGLDIQVNISGDPVIISGQPVDISGGHVYVESGVYLASGLAVTVESGIYVASGLAVIPQSGLGVLISGQHVYVESGVYLASGLYLDGAVSVSGNIVSISGNIVEVASGVYIASGLHTWISGQHVYVESGVYTASGIHVVSESGAAIIAAPDTVRSPSVLTVRGGIATCSGTQLPNNAVESVIIRNLAVTNTAGCSGSLYISGEQVWLGNGTASNPCSGVGMLLQSGEVITIDIDNMNKVYAWAETSGNQIALFGTDIA